MVFSHLLANESVVGVDIGSSSIKIVRVEPSKNSARVTHVSMCPTPPESIKEGVVVNVPEVSAAIGFALRSAGIKATSAIGAIAGPGVTVRQVQLPKMSEKALRQSIRFEASKHISSSIDDSVVEFDILGESDDPGQMNVMLVAAPNNMVESRVLALEQAGLEPIAIDIEGFASLRTLVECNPHSLPQGVLALLDIGASHSEINLISHGQPVLTRTIPIAGDAITNAIKNAEACSEEDAEQRKYSMDMSELVDAAAGTTQNRSLRVVQSIVDELLREIRRSINYYQSQLPEGSADTNVELLILTGGTSRLRGLVPYTRSRLNMETRMSESVISKLADMGLQEISIGADDVPLFSVAFGLAVKELPIDIRNGICAA